MGGSSDQERGRDQEGAWSARGGDREGAVIEWGRVIEKGRDWEGACDREKKRVIERGRDREGRVIEREAVRGGMIGRGV